MNLRQKPFLNIRENKDSITNLSSDKPSFKKIYQNLKEVKNLNDYEEIIKNISLILSKGKMDN